MAEFILKDWYGKEQTFDKETIYVRGTDGELMPFTHGTGGSADVRYVTFMSYDGLIEYGKKAVAVGDDCADPIARCVFDTPTRESDVQYNYTFYGWATEPNGGAVSNWNKAITEDKTVYANFTSTVRYYTITYYDSDGTTVLKTESKSYGSTLSYVPEKYGYKFTGWTPNPEMVSGDVSYYATWIESIAFADAPWSVIAEKSADGTASETWNIGDTKTIDITDHNGNPLTVTMMIGGFNHDVLADGSGKAGITLLTRYMTPYKTVWSTSGCFYNASTLNSLLENTVFSAFPEDLRSAIKSVNKKIDATTSSGTNAAQKTISSKVWAIARSEIETIESAQQNTISVNGDLYEVFSSKKLTRHSLYQNGSVGNAWLRDLFRYGSYNPEILYMESATKTTFGYASYSASHLNGVLFGFCI